MTADPHVAYPSGTYRRTTCYRQGCDALVPLAQDERLRGVYCVAHLVAVRVDAARLAATTEGLG
jgi:hypothetical protein